MPLWHEPSRTQNTTCKHLWSRHAILINRGTNIETKEPSSSHQSQPRSTLDHFKSNMRNSRIMPILMHEYGFFWYIVKTNGVENEEGLKELFDTYLVGKTYRFLYGFRGCSSPRTMGWVHKSNPKILDPQASWGMSLQPIQQAPTKISNKLYIKYCKFEPKNLMDHKMSGCCQCVLKENCCLGSNIDLCTCV